MYVRTYVCMYMYVCMYVCMCVYMYVCNVCVCVYVCNVYIYIQGVPRVKVSTSGFNSRADAESETSYTDGSNSQRFRIYEI